jgi:hypothetical protein
MTNYTLACATGSFALAGSASALKYARKMPVSPGSFTWSPRPTTTFEHGYPQLLRDTFTLRETQTTGLGVSIKEALLNFHDNLPSVNWIAHDTLTSGLTLIDAVIQAYGATLTAGVGVNDAMTRQYQGGAQIAEIVDLASSLGTRGVYHLTLANRLQLAESLIKGQTVKLTGGIGVHEVLFAARALQIMETLAIGHTATTTSVYHASLSELISLYSALGRFFGGSLSDGIGLHDGTNRTYVGHPVLADGIGLHDVIGNRLIWRVISQENMGFHDDQVLSAIYHGDLAEIIQIATAYISPGGGFTTWAMNTRTSAVTEYLNYAFNSFTRMAGSKSTYVGANTTGLYELNGNTDNGAAIISDIMSGFAQFAGSKFTSFKAAYLGIRGEGKFFLKLLTGDGRSYTYAVNSQSMLTTRVNLGKGLRARYFSFELISTGQDFDLESVEFVPITEAREV